MLTCHYPMRISHLMTYLFLLAAPAMLLAQAAVEFPVRTLDIGTVYEDADSVSGVFKVVNKGDAPLLIEGVYVSCGCVSATHSKEPIMPGESGTVTATLFPEGRNGRFLKSIYVYTNTIPRKNVVRLKADITEPKEERPKAE